MALGPCTLAALLGKAVVALVFHSLSVEELWPYSNSTYGAEISTGTPETMRGCMSRTPTRLTSM